MNPDTIRIKHTTQKNSAHGKHTQSKTPKINLKTLFILTLIISLTSSPLIIGKNNNINALPDFKIDYNNTITYTPTNLEPGQVYAAKNITHITDGIFNITLYVELLEYNKETRPLTIDTNIDITYTIGPQFTLKDNPNPLIGTFNINNPTNTITWTIPENLITTSIQTSFTIELKPDWTPNTHYYTNEQTTARFTPTNDNLYYYYKTEKTEQDAFTTGRFNWNNGANLFNYIDITDPSIDDDAFTLNSGNPAQIKDVMYDYCDYQKYPYCSEMGIIDYEGLYNAAPSNSWGCYKVLDVVGDGDGATYYFWIKSSTDSIFDVDGLTVYEVHVDNLGGNSSYQSCNRIVYYAVAARDPFFVWETDGEGSHVIEDLPGRGSIFIEKIVIQYSITYELDDGNNAPNNPFSYIVDDLPLIINAPSKNEHVFLGWDIKYTDDEPIEHLPMFNGVWILSADRVGDVTLIANWQQIPPDIYAITYELDGGTNAADNPPFYSIEDLPLIIVDPTKEDYVFLGWIVTYADETSQIVEPSYSIPQDTTGELYLTALWDPLIWDPIYHITYILNGGDNADNNPLTYTTSTLPIEIYNPTNEKYAFLGWTIICEDGTETSTTPTREPYNLPTDTIGDITLIANWDFSYNLTYELLGGNYADAPTSYTISMLPFKIDNPNRTGYTFTGWTIVYANNTETTRNALTQYEIPTGTTGNIILRANWTINNDPPDNNPPSTTSTPKTTPKTENPPQTTPDNPPDNKPDDPKTPPPPNNEDPPINYEFVPWTIVFTSGLIALLITFRPKPPNLPDDQVI